MRKILTGQEWGTCRERQRMLRLLRLDFGAFFLGAATLGTGALIAGLSARRHRRSPQHRRPRRRRSISRTTGARLAAARRAPTTAPRSTSTTARSRRQLPTDLDGVFYRVGPDPQYPKDPKYAGDIMFDGEGHVSMFRIKDGHVDYRTRYAKTQRWKAQHEARRSLFGMYRNPLDRRSQRQGAEPRHRATPSCSCTTASCWCSRRTARRSTWTR